MHYSKVKLGERKDSDFVNWTGGTHFFNQDGAASSGSSTATVVASTNYNNMSCAQLAAAYNSLNMQCNRIGSSLGLPTGTSGTSITLLGGTAGAGSGNTATVAACGAAGGATGAVGAAVGLLPVAVPASSVEVMSLRSEMLALLQVMYNKKCNCTPTGHNPTSAKM